MANYNNVIYSKVSYRRNIKYMPFVNKLSDTELALGVSRSLSEIFGEDLEFKSLKKMTLNECFKLFEEGFFSKEIIENKDISVYAANEQKSVIIFINEQDHIRLVAKEQGFKLEDCFNKANKLDDKILDKLEMSFDNNLGYLTANPTLVGTGLEISVLLFLPALTYGNKLKEIRNELLKNEFELMGYNGEKWDLKSAFVLIKNKYTFGHKENEFADLMQQTVQKILELEKAEESSIFNISTSTLVDTIYRAYGELFSCYRISEKEFEQKIGLVLWGVNLGLLICKQKLEIEQFIASFGNHHIEFENNNIKEIEKNRAKKINLFINKNLQKGDVDV